MKEYAEILAFPITKILNASYHEKRLPFLWKCADMIPLMKQVTVKQLERDARPISLNTPCISKLAEEFIVKDYVKPAALKIISSNQYGVIPQSSTTLALLSMIHNWIAATDGNCATVRVILFDYQKAFDFIDHAILVQKLTTLEIPRSIVNWIIDFLSDRLQRIKLVDSCYSE